MRDAHARGALIDARFDPLLSRVVACISDLSADWHEVPGSRLWLAELARLPEERRASIALAKAVDWWTIAVARVPSLIRAMARTIAELPCEVALPPVPSLPHRELSYAGEAALDTLAETLATKGAKKREVLTKAVSAIDGEKATRLLEKLAGDRGKKVRDVAAAALTKRKTSP
jgi:hypothetical protein